MTLKIQYMYTIDYKLLCDEISRSRSKRYVNNRTFKMLQNNIVSLRPLRLNACVLNSIHSAETLDSWTNLDEQDKNMSNMILVCPMKHIFHRWTFILEYKVECNPKTCYIHGSKYAIILFSQMSSGSPRNGITVFY